MEAPVIKKYEAVKFGELPKNVLEFALRVGAVVNAEADGHNGLEFSDIGGVLANGLVQFCVKGGLNKETFMDALETTWDVVSAALSDEKPEANPNAA